MIPLPYIVAGLAAIAVYFLKQPVIEEYSALTRTPQDIQDAVAKIDPEGSPELQAGAYPAPNSTDTWCNKFCYLVTDELGCPILWGNYGTLANDQIAWLASGSDGWSSTDEPGAIAAAVAGKVALATFYNPSGHGHIALVLPVDGDTAQIAQAGASNFNQGDLATGFGSNPVAFYQHA